MDTASKEKRAKNRVSSRHMLVAAGISFVEKNLGAHLIVTNNGYCIDFWPGTGKWIVRNGKLERRGVKKLIKYIKNEEY